MNFALLNWAEHRAVWPLLVALLVGLASIGEAQETSWPKLVLLDGQAVPFSSLQIAAGKLSGSGIPQSLTLDDLRRIEVAPLPEKASTKPAVVVEVRGEGRVLAKGINLANDKCQIAWEHGEPLEIPIDAVRAIRLDPAVASPDFDKALVTPSADLDRLFLKIDDGKLESVTGLLESLTEQQVAFEFEGQQRTVARDKLFGVVVAQPDATDTPPQSLVLFKDGSQLGGELAALAEGRLSLQISGGGKAEIPWSSVARVVVRSRRVAFLSDLKPVTVEEQPLVTLPRPWRRDANVGGNPLVIDGQTFEKGIGVHARSALTFAADAQYDVLAATIGIDASAAGKGDCLFNVMVDGQPRLSQRMRGTDPPRDIQVDITGAAQVTLVVEPGADLDLADHADWGDVRFIKNQK